MVDLGHADYVCYGHEHAPTTATYHLQGYLELPTKRTILGVVRLLDEIGAGTRFKLFLSRGSAGDNQQYCAGEGNFVEWGVPIPDAASGGAAEIARWDAARESARAGRFDEIASDLYIRYRSSFHAIHAESTWSVRREHTPLAQLRRWQAKLFDLVSGPPREREIHFIVGRNGLEGKSSFWKHLRATMGRDAIQVLRPGRGPDLAFLIGRARVYCVDVPRIRLGDIPYDLLEELKDELVQSTKYECITKEPEAAHVLVFCNGMPDITALSPDRYDIWDLNEDPELNNDLVCEFIE